MSDEITRTRVTYDLSEAKPVPVDMVEVYHLKHDNKIAIKWRRNPENDIIGYNVFSSVTPNGPWIKKNKALITNIQFVDECTNPTLNINHYYIVQAVNSKMIQGDLSLPERLKVQVDRKSHLYYPVQEIKRRALWLLKTRGEEADLWKRRYEGERCPCVSAEKPDGKGGCPICYGTSYIGGYYDPQRIRVSIELAPMRQIIEKHGLTMDDKPKGWTIWEPILNDRDVIVTDDNVRYEIFNNKPTQGQARDAIRQAFEIVRLDPSNIIYALSRPTFEAVTPATLEEEKTGEISNDSGIFEGDFSGSDKKLGFVRHSPHKDDNVFTEDATIERGLQGYKRGVRLNVGKWAGYISNRLGRVAKKDQSIQLYASDSTLKAKSRPDNSWLYTEGNFTATNNKPFEFSVEMTLSGSGYFYYEAVGIAHISRYIENQMADRLWFKKTNNIHFGIGSGEIFNGKTRAFVYCNDNMVIQKDIENLDLSEKNWLKIKFNGNIFEFYIDDTMVASFDAPASFADFRIVASAGAWAGEDILSIKPDITEAIVDIYKYRSNQASPVDLFIPELDARFFDDHVVDIGKYDGEILSAVVYDNFNSGSINEDLWKIAHLAPGHKLSIQSGRLTFTGISQEDNVNIMAVTGERLLDRTKGGDNESFIILREKYEYVSKLIVEVEAGSAGVGKSHNLVTITNLEFNPLLYTSFGLFFDGKNMVETGLGIREGWEMITKSGLSGGLNKMKIVYDFKNDYAEFFVNGEMVFSHDVPAFPTPIIVLSVGNKRKHQQLINVFDNFKILFEYLDKPRDLFDNKIIR